MSQSDLAAASFNPSDPTSLSVDMGKLAEGQRQRCIWYNMPQCEFNMDDIHTLSFDVTSSGCGKQWICPLWSTPRYWGTSQDHSGEVDYVENCAGNLNIAFGSSPGMYHKWGNATAESLAGHVTIHFDQGKDHIWGDMCPLGGERDDCAHFDHWGYFAATAANRAHGNVSHFVSDIWNGQQGSALDVCSLNRDPYTNCKYSVSNIKMQGNKGPLFSGECSALNG